MLPRETLTGPDGSPITIRSGVPDDAPALLAYLRRVGAESQFLSFGAEGPPIDEVAERAYLTRVATADNALVLLAEWHGALVGCLTFNGGNRERTHHVGEFGISVAKVCTGVGLGRRLLEMLIAWARAGTTVRKINLVVRADNDRAIALYESLGFAVEGRRSRDMLIDGTFHDSLIMGRPIDPGIS